MFRKFEKTSRIVVPQIGIKGKHYLSSKDTSRLLDGIVDIEEKLDGANAGIVRHNRGYHLQKRGSLMGTGEHDQFTFMGNWARANKDKILSFPVKWIVYVELMFTTHNIYYDQLPSYVIVIEIWDGKRYVSRAEKEHICKEKELKIVPLLHHGYEIKSDIFHWIDKAEYSSYEIMEGVVVKNYKKQMRGKVVRAEFIKQIEDEGHWIKKSSKRNKLIEGVNWYE